jgi:hypothetical protein
MTSYIDMYTKSQFQKNKMLWPMKLLDVVI